MVPEGLVGSGETLYVDDMYFSTVGYVSTSGRSPVDGGSRWKLDGGSGGQTLPDPV